MKKIVLAVSICLLLPLLLLVNKTDVLYGATNEGFVGGKHVGQETIKLYYDEIDINTFKLSLSGIDVAGDLIFEELMDSYNLTALNYQLVLYSNREFNMKYLDSSAGFVRVLASDRKNYRVNIRKSENSPGFSLKQLAVASYAFDEIGTNIVLDSNFVEGDYLEIVLLAYNPNELIYNEGERAVLDWGVSEPKLILENGKGGFCNSQGLTDLYITEKTKYKISFDGATDLTAIIHKADGTSHLVASNQELVAGVDVLINDGKYSFNSTSLETNDKVVLSSINVGTHGYYVEILRKVINIQTEKMADYVYLVNGQNKTADVEVIDGEKLLVLEDLDGKLYSRLLNNNYVANSNVGLDFKANFSLKRSAMTTSYHALEILTYKSGENKITYLYFNLFDEVDFSFEIGLQRIVLTQKRTGVANKTITLNATQVKFTFVDREIPDDVTPTFLYSTANIFTNVNKPLTESEVVGMFGAVDDKDGNISEKIVIESSTYNPLKTGDYVIELSVSDTSGNTAYLSVNVNVADSQSPKIIPIISNNITSNQSDLIPTSFDVLDYFKITDNYDAVSDLVITIVDHGGFATNNNLLKSYSFTMEVKDLSGNKTTHQFTITVVDDIAPLIVGVDLIEISYMTGLSKEYVLSKYVATDNNDVVTIELVDNQKGYFYNKKNIGSYLETIRATDTAGNITDFVVNIKVIDSEIPMFYIDSKYYIVLDNTPATTFQILDFLVKTGQLELDSYVVVEDGYADNSEMPGVYQIELSVKGVSEVLSVEVIVGEEEVDNSSELGFWAKLWKSIVNFFKGLWNVIKWPLQKIYEGVVWLLEKIGL